MGSLCSRQHYKSVMFRELVQDGKLEKLKKLYQEENEDARLLLDTDSEGRQPLHIAAQLGYPNITQFLVEQMLSHSLDIDKDSGSGKTPLLLACMRGYKDELEPEKKTETVAILLKAKANPQAKNSNTGMNCLHWAAYYNKNPETLKLLLENKGNILAIDCQGYTPFDIAGMKSGRRNYRNLDILLEYAFSNIDLQTCFIGVEGNFSSIAPTEMISKFQVAAQSSFYSDIMKAHLTILYWAALRNNVELVSKLLSKGISPFVKDYNNESALLGAINGDSYETVKLILESDYVATDCDSSFNVKYEGLRQTDLDRNTPLHIAGLLNKYKLFDYISDVTELKREYNLHGKLPSEYNNHAKVNIEKHQGEYVVVVDKTKDESDTILSQLKRAGFDIKEYPCAEPDLKFLVLIPDENDFHEAAKELELEVVNKEVGILENYNEARREMYYPFSYRQKHMMIQYMIKEELDLVNYIVL